MAITVVTPTLKDVQWLADHPTGEAMVVSCYADTSVSSGVRPLWREHLKSEVKRIDETLADASAARAEFHRNVAAIEAVLSSRRLASARGVAVAQQVVHEAPHAWVGRQVSLESKIGAIHGEALREHDRHVLEDVKRRLIERHHIAIGPQAVIDAIRNDEVGYRGCVVMESDRGEVASRCTECGSLLARFIDECPSCHGRCEKTNLWQAIALLAAGHHVSVHFVESGQGLEKQSGVVALLAREEASMPALAASPAPRGAAPPEQRP